MFLSWLLITALIVACVNDAGARPPNFVIMFMDDMGYGDLGCYGNPSRETPHLDRMAEEGMLFTDFYSGSAICSPSRAALLSGRLPIRNGFYSTNKKARNSYSPQDVMGGIADSEILFSEVLKEHGYKNKIVGKWHLGHRDQYLPLKHGFHEWFGAPNCHYKYDDKVMPNIPVYKDELMTGRYYDDYKIDHETGIGNMTQLYIEEALEWIERQHTAGEPFLLYWAPDATHTPLFASHKFRGQSERGLYGDAVMEIDHGVGQILDKLRHLGIDNNTFAMFSSDNGAATYAHTHGGSNGPLLCGKQTTFEGGFRQPTLAWWPGKIRAGKESRQVGKLMDIFPTLLEMAGIEAPKVVLDGESILDVLLHDPPRKDRAVFYYRGDTLFKVRYGEYKAHLYTWGTPDFAKPLGYYYCPGQHVENVTTEEMRDYRKQPLLFHVGRDPGEKFHIDPETEEYMTAMTAIKKAIDEHVINLTPGKPEFNWCDLAVQNWTPKGCEKVNRCMKAPKSYPYRCDWPY